MKILFYSLSGLLTLAGVVWILQGTNVLHGSAMSGQSTWVYLGVMAVIAGATLFYYAKSIIAAPPK